MSAIPAGIIAANRRRGGGGGGSGSRYWRIFSYAEQAGPGTAVAIAEAEFRATIGGADVTGSGTPSASNAAFGAASNAFDNNAATFWASGSDLNHWLAYDFAAAQEVLEFSITPRAGGDATQAPGAGWLERSSDGSTWKKVFPFIPTLWAGGTAQVFSEPAAASSHRYWRIVAVRSYGATFSASNIEMRATAGGADLTGSGTPLSSSEFSGSFLDDYAFDGSSATAWISLGGRLEWIGYDFGSNVSVTEVTWAARTDSNPSQVPSAGAVQYSDDGSTWVTAWSFFNSVSAPSLGQVLTFTKPTWPET